MDPRDRTPWHEGPAPRERPYLLTSGRTRPAHHLDLISLVKARPLTSTDRLASAGAVDLSLPNYTRMLELCRDRAVSIAEISARLPLPVQVTKILVGDLLTTGRVIAALPDETADPTDRHMLEGLLAGLRKL
ncbi:DUF742 domain-containing protein [Streptomyces sp. NPDC058391]|uniref:DUF742 domain-containing protein n=1 Tax=Streptomyces sp. NPDC058391 TaxID=3346476 RepID=UPI00365906D5